MEKRSLVPLAGVGDIGRGPKSDISGQGDVGLRIDACLDFPAYYHVTLTSSDKDASV